MEDVIKFSKVANISTADANKILTTAMSNGLASDTGHVMDALVALGDAAATSAEELSKGMQKSAASAVQAGVSLEELVTMLTIITSRTQLGGNQAGTALQTLMYRLYRVSEGDDYYDEDGNRVGSNEATRALKQIGVNVYNDDGSQRGVFEIMTDVAKNWNAADTVSQEMVLNSLGAGRQRSNIATLIQGLAEDDGELAEKYMGLAEGSDGITDEKYVAYLESMTAAVTNLSNAFDKLIESMNVGGVISGLVDILSGFINGLATVNEMTGLVTVAIVALSAALVVAAGHYLYLAMSQLIANAASGNFLKTALAIAGITAAVTVGLGVIGSVVNAFNKDDKTETMLPPSSSDIDLSASLDKREHYRNLIDQSHRILEDGITDSEYVSLQANLDELTAATGRAAYNLRGSADEIQETSDLLDDINADLEGELADIVRQKVRLASTEALGQWAANSFDRDNVV